LPYGRNGADHRATPAILVALDGAVPVLLACQKRATRASVSRFVPVLGGNTNGRARHARACGKSVNLPLF
jgi:hypothetical protein